MHQAGVQFEGSLHLFLAGMREKLESYNPSKCHWPILFGGRGLWLCFVEIAKMGLPLCRSWWLLTQNSQGSHIVLEERNTSEQKLNHQCLKAEFKREITWHEAADFKEQWSLAKERQCLKAVVKLLKFTSLELFWFVSYEQLRLVYECDTWLWGGRKTIAE